MLRRAVVRRADRRGVAVFRDAAAGSSLAFSSLLATRAIVLNEPLNIFNVRLATSPTWSWRFAWTLTTCRPRIAIRSGRRPAATFPAALPNDFTASMAGAVAAL